MSNLKNLKGKTFGRLLVIERAENKNSKVQWLCKCSCGNLTIKSSDNLLSGHTKSCGCLHKEKCIQRGLSSASNLIGQTFNKLTVIKRLGTKNHDALWLCKCSCGNLKEATTNQLKRGRIQSCGCYRKEFNKIKFTTHGKTNTRLHHIWLGMKSRCYNPNNKRYSYYGGRGIYICNEWLDDFMNFYTWALTNGYQNNLSIDRINNDKGYYPDNCRWATAKEQAQNRRKPTHVQTN